MMQFELPWPRVIAMLAREQADERFRALHPEFGEMVPRELALAAVECEVLDHIARRDEAHGARIRRAARSLN